MAPYHYDDGATGGKLYQATKKTMRYDAPPHSAVMSNMDAFPYSYNKGTTGKFNVATALGFTMERDLLHRTVIFTHRSTKSQWMINEHVLELMTADELRGCLQNIRSNTPPGTGAKPKFYDAFMDKPPAEPKDKPKAKPAEPRWTGLTFYDQLRKETEEWLYPVRHLHV